MLNGTGPTHAVISASYSLPRWNWRAAWAVALILLAPTLTNWSFPLGPDLAGAAEVLTNQNVIAMARSGLPESLILTKIQSTDAQFDLSSRGLITLKQGGVSDAVILAIMNRATSGPSLGPAPPPAAPGSVSPSPLPAFPSAVPLPGQSVPGCPQLAQPDPYRDVRNLVAQLRAQAGQPGMLDQGQTQAFAGQIQTALDGRDAALRRGACDTSQYEQQIGSLVASLQSALAASTQAGPPPPASAPQPPAYGYTPQVVPPPPAPGNPPQVGSAGAPPGAPYQAAPGAPSQSPSAGEVFSKLFDIAIDKLAKRSKRGGDSGNGQATASQPPTAYYDPSTPPSFPSVAGIPGTPGQSNPSSSSPPQSSHETSPSNPASPPSSSGFSSLPVLPSPISPQSPVPHPAALPTLPQLQDLAKVTGTVRTEWGDAIAGAIVSVVEWNKSVMTGSDGTYVLQGPARQSVTIQVQAFGYLSTTSATAVSPGAVTTQHIALVWARRPMRSSGR